MEKFLDNKFDFITVQNKYDLEKLESSQFKIINVMTATHVGFNLKSNSKFVQDIDLR